jgi:hypothetical protein
MQGAQRTETEPDFLVAAKSESGSHVMRLALENHAIRAVEAQKRGKLPERHSEVDERVSG